MMFSGGVLHDQPASRGLAGERDLGDPLVLRQRLAALDAEAVDDIEHARRQEIADHVHQHHDAHRRLLGGLEHDAVAGGQRRSQLPDRHQQREVPRDDLADDAQRLVEVVGDRVVVDLATGCPPARGCSRRSSGNGRSPAARRRRSSRGSACRCRASRPAPAARAVPPSGRRSGSGSAARCAGDVLPHLPLAAWAASSASSMSSAVERAISHSLAPVTGVGLSKYWPRTGAIHLPSMKLS